MIVKTKANVFRRIVAAFLAVLMLLAAFPVAVTAAEDETVLLGAGEIVKSGVTVWNYLDDNTDPAAGASERTAWTAIGYHDEAWKRAAGSFGAKNGAIADLGGGYTPKNLLNQYIEGTTDIPAFFFRAEFDLAEPDAVKTIAGSVVYDDCAIVYINGVKVAGFDDGDITANMQYGGSNAGAPKTGEIGVSGSMLASLGLRESGNVLAVELHQGRANSSDMYFDMPLLTFGTEAFKATIRDILVNVGENSATRYVTWQSDSGEAEVLELYELTDGVRPASATYTVTPAYVPNTDGSGYYNYHAGLADVFKDGKTYAYRVGSEDCGWSDFYTLTSPLDDTDKTFSFLLAGDPQIGCSGAENDAENWNGSLETVRRLFGGEIEFLLSVGDQVNVNSSAEQYAGYASPAWLRTLPMAVNVGNHDSGGSYYSEHYTVPNFDAGTSTAGTYGGDYWFAYDGALFMSINSNNRDTAKHKAFLQRAIAAYTEQYGEPTWKIVTFHHSVFSTATHYQDSDIVARRAELPAVFTELGIDVVLQGHDHVYTRSYMMRDASPVDSAAYYTAVGDDPYGSVVDPDAGLVFYLTANSGSGSKHYANVNTGGYYSAFDNQENTPNLTRIDVAENTISFTTYRTGAASGESDILDSFRIIRTGGTHADIAPTLKVPADATFPAGSIESFDPKEGVSAFDAKDGDLTDAVTVSGEVDCGTPGIYTLVYTVEDAAGNQVRTERKVTVTRPVETKTVVSTADTVWSYLDDNTDPAGENADRQIWTRADFDDTAWKRAKGAFGAKNGVLSAGAHDGYSASTLLTQYKDGTNENIPAFFFRTAFDLDDPAAVTELAGRFLYDDGIKVYINGVQVGAFNVQNVTGNMSYNNGKSAGNAAEANFSLSGDALNALGLKKTGNILAVELHQDGVDSSDIFFDAVSLTVSAVEPEKSAALLINQVYGGGGKGETPIANSFIELCNVTAEAVDLAGYTLHYGDKQLALAGTVPAGGSYLIVGAPEATDANFLTYTLPKADAVCDWVISNKSYTVTLKKDGSDADIVTAGADDVYTAISKQKTLRRADRRDTDTLSDFEVITWKKGDSTVDAAFIAAYAPRNSAGEAGEPYGALTEPEYTPVVTTDERVTGFFNADAALKLELAARYNSGAMSKDGGSLEIVAYNAANGFAYAVSGIKGKLIAVDLNGSLKGSKVAALAGVELDIEKLVTADGFTYGDMTSVAVSPDGTRIAVALQDADYAKNGIAAVFTANKDGSLTDPAVYTTGVQPDMIVFANNGTVLTANEGEPRDGIGGAAVDPDGTVTVIDLSAKTAVHVGFESFDAESLTAKNILIGQKDGVPFAPAKDLEPEYIAVTPDGKTAYVSLQEANAIAVLDIAAKRFTGIYSAGFEDYGKVAVDLIEDGKYAPDTYAGLLGARMPDGIAVMQKAGKTYLLTANEGDAREWGKDETEFANETKKQTIVSDGGSTAKVKMLNTALCAGLPSQTVMLGGRSFTIFEVTENGLAEVFDSGSEFESVTAAKLPDFFNASNDDATLDSRSPKKGPEPETVTVGKVGTKTYAFIAIERIGGIMVYDITTPDHATFVNYINSRDFTAEIAGDVSPEGLAFIPAADSRDGSAVLLAANEVSGTLAAYTLTEKKPSGGGNGNGSSGGNSTPKDPAPEVKPEDPAGTETAAMPFADVAKDNWYYDAVAYVYGKQIMTGTAAERFDPETETTRAMLVTLLYRLAGSPGAAETGKFNDVAADAYYDEAVAWAAETGLVSGYGAGVFGPNDSITREQLVTLLYRYAKLCGYTRGETGELGRFTDAAEVSDYAAEAMSWAVGSGMILGADGKLLPDAHATRAEVAALLMRFCEAYIK